MYTVLTNPTEDTPLPRSYMHMFDPSYTVISSPLFCFELTPKPGQHRTCTNTHAHTHAHTHTHTHTRTHTHIYTDGDGQLERH